MKYIHYGNSKFIPDLFIPIKNEPFRNKPRGGLWACNAETDDWSVWCHYEDVFLDCLQESFTFKLKPDTRFLVLNSEETIRNLPQVMKKDYVTYYPDFEKISKDYDVIVYECNEETYRALYGWDLDSILILNKEVIIYGD